MHFLIKEVKQRAGAELASIYFDVLIDSFLRRIVWQTKFQEGHG